MKVGGAARRKTYDPAHWPRRIGLRPSETRGGRQRGRARCQMEKISAGKFHFAPPFTLFDHLVGASEQRRRHLDAERLGGFEIDDQLELGGLQDGQVGWLFALENSACSMTSGCGYDRCLSARCPTLEWLYLLRLSADNRQQTLLTTPQALRWSRCLQHSP